MTIGQAVATLPRGTLKPDNDQATVDSLLQCQTSLLSDGKHDTCTSQTQDI